VTHDLVVVGLGSAGIVAAELATTLGARVAAVERDRVGGDCLWTGCVPSKALLAAAKAAHTMRTAARFGLPAVEPSVDTAAVWSRVRAVQDRIAATSDSPERLRAHGIDLRFGAGRLLGGGRVAVGGDVVSAPHVLLATGSVPALPDVPGLAEAGPLTSASVFALERAPASVAVLGGGPQGAELAQAFARLGVPCALVGRAPRLVPRDEPELAARLEAVLRADGVAVHLGATVERVEVDGDERVLHARTAAGPLQVRAAAVLVAAGRAVDVEGLGLGAAGVEVGEDGVVVDDRLRTSAPGVWAAGDVCGRAGRFTHNAGLQGARVVRNALAPGTQAAPASVPWCTFTDPELARVGLTEAEARAAHGDRAVRVWRHELADSDRARAEEAETGAILLVTARGRLVGAHVLAPAAGELIHALALAVHRRMRLASLADVVHVYPTVGTGVQLLAGDAAVAGPARLAPVLRVLWRLRRR